MTSMDRNEEKNSYQNRVSTRRTGEMAKLKRQMRLLTALAAVLLAAVIIQGIFLGRLYVRGTPPAGASSGTEAAAETETDTQEQIIVLEAETASELTDSE